MRICIIDDNSLLSDALTFGLSDQGHEVIQALNGVDGIAAVERDAPDVVLIDWQMPGMRGDAVAERVRALGSEAVVILMSGGSAREDLQAARERQGLVDYFIEKPFTPRQLLGVIDRLSSERSAAK